MKGDTIAIDHQGARRIFRVKKFYEAGSMWLTHANNAQKDDEQNKRQDYTVKAPE